MARSARANQMGRPGTVSTSAPDYIALRIASPGGEEGWSKSMHNKMSKEGFRFSRQQAHPVTLLLYNDRSLGQRHPGGRPAPVRAVPLFRANRGCAGARQ